MWLLDANMPVQLVALLKELGIEADCAVARGWNTLNNGSLVSAAVQAKFTALLTRDRLFAESSAQALKVHNEFCIGLDCRNCAPASSCLHSARPGGRSKLPRRQD
jgi:predicted nuclease of predicted toxin-antitoxin system